LIFAVPSPIGLEQIRDVLQSLDNLPDPGTIPIAIRVYVGILPKFGLDVLNLAQFSDGFSD
jgi:hypothetical protein